MEFINAIICSRWSARSLANANKEYILICDQLSPTIITDIENHNGVSQSETSIKDFLIGDYSNNIATIQQLKKQLIPLKISSSVCESIHTLLTFAFGFGCAIIKTSLWIYSPSRPESPAL